MQTPIPQIIDQYLAYVHAFCTAMESSYQVPMSAGAWRVAGFNQDGTITVPQYGMVQYSFHGAGCLTRWPDGSVVDFDFPFGIEHLDTWKLWRFVESVDGMYGYLDQKDFQAYFAK